MKLIAAPRIAEPQSRALGNSMRMSLQRIALILLPVLLFAGCRRKQAEPPPAIPEVLVVAAEARDVSLTHEWVGTLDGSENAEIRARVTGYLIRRNYQEGGPVTKGQVLFEIDDRPFVAALAEAKQQLEQAKAVQLASEAEAKRNKELFEKKVISDSEYINKTQANEANIAKVRALEAAVDQAKLNLEFCKIVAPIDGVAGIAKAQVGDLVGTATSSVLTTVSTLDPIKIAFPISESEYLEAASRIQESLSTPLDQRPEMFELILADGKAFEHKGRLLSIDLSIKESTGTIMVNALARNPGNFLRPGLFARARVLGKPTKDAVVVPQRSVQEVQGSYQVIVIGADGKAEIRPVQVGPRTGSDWVIKSGLKAGETVVVEGALKVRAGMPVVAKPWTPPAKKQEETPAKTAPAAEPK